MHDTQIAGDLAKAVFEVAVSERPGQVRTRHRLSREGFRRFAAEQAPARVWLETCGSAHHWGRTLQRLGHDVAVLSPAARMVRPLVQPRERTLPLHSLATTVS